MRHYICPYCDFELRGHFQNYCPNCEAVLTLSKHEMQNARMDLLLNEAKNAIFETNWRFAINNLMIILTLDPDNNSARELMAKARIQEMLAKFYIQGQLHQYNQRWEKALKYFKKIREKDADYKDVGIIIRQIERTLLEEKLNKPGKAEVIFRKVAPVFVLLIGSIIIIAFIIVSILPGIL